MPKTSIKILLIEDSPADALLLKEVLNNDSLTDFQVTVVEQLKQGLAELAASKYDALLLDLGLPDSQGLQTFEKARAQFPDMPTIVLSGLTDETLALQAVQSGAQDYLVKGETGWNLGPRAIRYAIERFQNQSAMRASEARFSTVFHSSPTSIAITRISDNKILEVNKAWTKITGYSSAEVVGRVLGEINFWTHPEEREQIVNLLRKDGVVHGFEVQIRRKSGQLACMLFSAELIEVAREPCMLSMVLDITERKQVEKALRESEERFRAISEVAGDMIFSVTADGTVNYANDGASRMFGMSSQELVGRQLRDLFPPRVFEQQWKSLKKVFKTGEPLYKESVSHFPNGDVWLSTWLTPLRDDSGSIVTVLGNSRDITERKRAEEKLRESEERYKTITESTMDVIFIIDKVGKQLFFNESVERVLGYKVNELIGKPFTNFVPKKELPKYFGQLNNAFQNKEVKNFVTQIYHKDGHLMDVEINGKMIKQNGVYVAQGSIRDITERKRAEQALVENEAKLKEAEKNAHLGYYDIDTTSGKTIWSEETYRIFGLDMAEYDPNVSNYNQYIHQDDIQKVFDLFDECVKEGKPFDMTYRIVRPNGEIRHVHSKSTIIAGEQNNPTRLFGTIQDVTERVQTEKALRDSEEKFRNFIEQSTEGLMISDEQGMVIEWNHALEKINGIPREQALGMTVWDIQSQIMLSENSSPANLDVFRKHLQTAAQTGQSPYFGKTLETALQTKSGERKTIQQTSFPIKTEKGYLIGATIRDVTERKGVEERLRESEEHYRLLFENSPIGIYRTTPAGDILAANPALVRMLGYSSAEKLFTRNLEQGDADSTYWRVLFKERVEREGSITGLEAEWNRYDGTPIFVRENAQVVRDESGAVLYYEGTIEDITERKQVDDKLRKLSRAVEQSPTSIVITDVSGNIEYVNPKFSQVTGYSMEEVLGQNPRILKSGFTSDEEYKKMWETITSGNVWQGELLNKKKDGETYWEIATIAPVFSDEGKITNFLAMKENITEQKQAENRLKLRESYLTAIIENQPGLVWLKDKDSRFLTVNTAFALSCGRTTPEEVTRKTDFDVWPGELAQKYRSDDISLMSGKKPSSFEEPIFDQGQTKWFETFKTPVFDEAGNIIGTAGYAQDITERKQAEEALRLSEANLNRAQSVAHVGSWNLDITRNILSWSPETYRIFGVSAEMQRIDESFLTHIHPDDMGLAIRSWQAALQGIPYDVEHRILADGEVKWVRERAELEADAQGNFVRAIGTVQDITAHKQAEELRLQAEENYRNIFENALEGIFQSLPQGRFITVNPAFALMLGYASPNKMIETITDIASQVYVDSPHRAEFMRVMAERGSVTGFEFQMKRKDGGIIWVSESARAVCDETGKLLYYEGSVENITERKRAEEALRESEAFVKVILDNLPIGIAVNSIEPTVTFNYINDNFLKFYRTTREKIAAPDSFWNAVYEEPDFREKIKKEVLADSSSGNPKHMAWVDVPITRKGEETTFITARNIPVPNKPLIISTVWDVTERKRAEDALAASEAKLRALIEQAPTIVYSESAETRETVYISPQVEKITGYLPAEWIEDHDMWKKIIHPTDLAAVLAEDELTTENCEPFQIEYRILTKDGRTLWIHDEAVMIKSQDGTPLSWQGVMYDITERKQAEEEIHRHAVEFASLYESSKALAGKTSLDEVLKNITESVRRLFGVIGVGAYLYDPDTRMLEVKLATLPTIPVGTRLSLGEGLAGKVAQSRRSIRIDDYAVWEGRSTKYEGIPIHATLETPLIYQDELIGVLVMHETGDSKRKFTEADERLLSLFATQAAAAIQNVRLFEKIQQRVLELELLYESGLVFSQLLNPKEIAQKIIALLGEKLDWHHTAIRLLHEPDKSLELLAFDLPGLVDKSEESKVEARLKKTISRFGDGLSGWALQQSKTLRLGDVNSDPHYTASYPGIHSGLYVPLKSGDHTLGVISIESERPNAFSETDEQLITTLANQAANALENARLYQEISHHAEVLEQRVQERTAEIESTRQRLSLAVQTAGIGIWELDVKQNKDYWDDGLFSLYGLSKENNAPSPKIWHNVIHPDDLLQQLKLMDESLHHNQPYNSEFRVIWPDASVHHIKSTGIVIRDVEGLPERMIGANQDITLHKQAEETLHLANVEMERGLRIKNEFLANMSHELRTPLNAILGISESLEEQRSSTLDEKQLRYVRIIIESGRHLLDMINDILDLSKIEAGKLELNIQSTSVEKLCASSLRMVRELAHKKSQNISLKLDEKVKVISGDERRLKQSLVNLLGNAIKFTPPGGKIGLEVSGSAEANEVTFTVWDEGIGIDPEDIQRLFKPFVQLNAGLAREYSGTGLGLALVAQMARLHGGRVNLTSKLKLGSRFMLTLPWMPAEQAVPQPPKPQVLAGSSKPDRKHTGKILIVDDVEMAAELIGEYLRNIGFETFVAGDGLEAVSIAKQEHPQLIFMDVMMPKMSGIEATKQIRADESLRDVLIIGLTALAMPEDREQCLAAGMNDHLSKPIQMQELLQTIERYLP